MQEAADAFAEVLAGVTFAPPSAPVVSNADARPYPSGSAGPEDWQDRLAAHLVSPVRWRPSMVTMVEELGATALVEVGCGSMLAGLAKRCVPGVPIHGVGSPTDVALLPEVHT
jgi:malonyl CoA-acyl carrier protein transacylase